MKSWKTTLGGIVASVGAALQASEDGTLKLIGVVLLTLGTALFGVTARDNDKSSEDVDVKL